MANKAVEILLRARDTASGVISRLGNRVRTMGDNSRTARGSVQDLGNTTADASTKTQTLAGAVGSLTTRLVAFIGIGAGLAKLRQGLNAIFSVGSRFESLETQLEALTGSAEEAEVAFEWIQEFTKNTPFQLEEVAESFARLKAFGLDPMDGTLQALVDQTAKLGGGQQRLNGIIIAVGQAWAKQKLQAEETLQLVERGVPVYDLLSEALGITAGEIEDLSRNGELGRDAIQALIDAIGDNSVGAAAKEMENAAGIVSNLKDRFTEFFNEIAEQGVLEYFKNELRDLSDRMKQMAADGSLQELARKISDSIIRASEAVKGFVGLIVSLSSELKALAGAFIALKFGAMLKGFWGMAGAAAAATVNVKALTAAMIRTGWGAIAVGIGIVVSKLWELNEITASEARNQAMLADKAREVDQVYADLSERLGIQIENSKELAEAERKGLIVFDEKLRQYEKVAEKTREVTEAERQYVSELKGVSDAVTSQASAIVSAAYEGQEFVKRLGEMKEGTKGLAGELEKMNAADFASFAKGFKQAVDNEYLPSIEEMETHNAIIMESWRRLNVDVEKLKSGMTSAGASAVAAFDFMADSAGKNTEIIKAAFDGALNSVQSRAGLDQLKQRVEALGEAGKLTGQEVSQALEDIKARAQEVDEKILQAKEALSGFANDINTAETVSQLNDVGIAAAQAWEQGKISAEEYLQTMAQVDEQKRKLIETLKEQAAAEKAAAAAAADKAKNEEQGVRTVVVARQAATEAAQMEAEALARAYEEANKSNAARIGGMAGLKKYWRTVEGLKNAYIQANERAADLTNEVAQITAQTDASKDSLSSYADELRQAITNGHNLNDQSLDRLRGALDDVENRLKSINSETQSARTELVGLQGELASLEGDQRRVQQLQYQQRRLDLEHKIQQAQASGNSAAVKSYKESLSILEQINEAKLEDIRENERQAKQRAQEQRRRSQTGSTSANVTSLNPSQPAAASPIPAGRTVRLQFEGANGESAEVAADESEVDRVISVLQASGARTR